MSSSNQSPRFLSFDSPKSNEHPTHSLFISNINPNVPDESYTRLLQSFGEIDTLNLSTKSREFLIVTYYDIRHSKLALKTLQKTKIEGKILDVHFTISRPGNQMNQGTIVVFNLDETISHQTIQQLFNVYGEIKDVRITPNKKHHRFIEFYDTRSAEQALKGMNGTQLNGKKLKIEFSRPGGKESSFIMEDLIEHFNSQERQRTQSDCSITYNHRFIQRSLLSRSGSITDINSNGNGFVSGNNYNGFIRERNDTNNHSFENEISETDFNELEIETSFMSFGQRRRAKTVKNRLKPSLSSLSNQQILECNVLGGNSLFSKTPEQILSDNCCSDESDDDCCLDELE